MRALLSIVTEVKPVHPEKVPVQIVVMFFPKLTDFRLMQLLKALFPMLVTDSGKTMEVRPVQPWKA
jgi:hypothetical protein